MPAVPDLDRGSGFGQGELAGVVADRVGDGPLVGRGDRAVEGGRGQQVRPKRHPFGGGDRLGHGDLDPRDRPAPQQPGAANRQVVIEQVRHRAQEPLAVLVAGVAGPEDPHDRAGRVIAAADRLSTLDHGPPSGPVPLIQVGHDLGAAGGLDSQAAAVGGPGEQPVLDVLERHSVGVVVTVVALLFSAPVPSRAAAAGETDQGVGVEPGDALSGHARSPSDMTKPDPGSGIGQVGGCAVGRCAIWRYCQMTKVRSASMTQHGHGA